MASLPTARIPHGYLTHNLDERSTRLLSTSASIPEEIFSTLEFHSEVDEVGLKFLQAKSGCSEAEAKIIYPKFQAFIRQAKTFYIPAETLHHRARPLFYYYAFLNLAKAFLCVKDPSLFLTSDKFSHGISETHSSAQFSVEAAEVSEKGVFVELYKALKGAKLPKGTKLNIREMLKYSTDICFDYESKSADLNIARGKSIACLDKSGKNRWALIAVNGLSELEKKSSAAFVQFHSLFDSSNVIVDRG